MNTNFEFRVRVDLGVTPELMALVTALTGQRVTTEVRTSAVSEQQKEQKPRRGRKAAEPVLLKEPEMSAENSADVPAEESAEQAPAEERTAESSADPAPADDDTKELTEQNIREAMHLTRQRIEGEDYKDNPESEGYKLYHRQLTQEFKNIASLLGADKPSQLPVDQRRSFIMECNLLVAKDGKITKIEQF